MSVSLANLRGGPAKVTIGGATLFTREDIIPRHTPTWQPVPTSMHGTVDKAATDQLIKFNLRLWGAYENLSVLFPSYVVLPDIGRRIFDSSPVVIHGKNQDRLTYHNAAITKLADLFLGVDQSIFAADVEITALIDDGKNPEDADAYFTADTGVYSDATFAKTNYKQQRYSAAWGAIGGFATFQAKLGWNIGWTLDLQPDKVDAVGTPQMILADFMAQAKCIPIEPTNAQIIAASRFQASAGNALGRLLSTNSADLVITGSGVSVTLKNAGITEHGFAFGITPHRNGEITWETTTGFAAGVAAAIAAVA